MALVDLLLGRLSKLSPWCDGCAPELIRILAMLIFVCCTITPFVLIEIHKEHYYTFDVEIPTARLKSAKRFLLALVNR